MKKVYLSVFVLFIVMFAAACSNSSGTTSTSNQESAGNTSQSAPQDSKEEEQYTLKLAHGFPTGAYHHTFMEWFAKEVDNKSEGRLKIEIYPTAQLMPPDQEIPGILQGQIDMSHSSSPVLAGFDPIWNFYELPFIFKYDPKDPNTFLENRIKFNNSENGGKLIAKKMEEKGLKVISLSFVDMFGSVFTASKDNLITSPESAKGLRLRTPGGMMGPETAKAIGASSMTIAGAEVITALQQGVVDGLLTTPIYAHDAKLPVESFSVVPVFNSVTPVLMSLEKFESLPADLQEILLQAGKDLENYAKETVAEKALTVYTSMEEQGIEIYYPTDKEMKHWEEVTKPARDVFESKVEGGTELLSELANLQK